MFIILFRLKKNPECFRFDTSGSIIELSVSEISALGGFCDKQHEDEEELGILVVGFNIVNVAKEILVTPASANVVIKSSQMGARVGVEAARPDVWSAKPAAVDAKRQKCANLSSSLIYYFPSYYCGFGVVSTIFMMCWSRRSHRRSVKPHQ